MASGMDYVDRGKERVDVLMNEEWDRVMCMSV